MATKSINNKLCEVRRKKIYLTLTFILLSLFLTIFINQFPSPYTMNSFAAGTSNSVNSPVYLAYFYEVGCHDCDKVKIILNDISADYPDNLILSLIHISEPTRLGMISYAVFC